MKRNEGRNTFLRRIISLLLVFTLLSIAGCGKAGEAAAGSTKQTDTPETGSTSGTGDGEKAMGRYVEDSQDLSDMIMRADGMVKMQDGSIVIQDYYNGQIVSKDNGHTWEPSAQPWLTEWNEKYYIHDMQLSSDGYIAVMYFAEQEETAESDEGEDVAGEDEAEEDTVISVPEMDGQYALIDPEGNSTPIDIDSQIGINLLWFSDEGDLFIISGSQIYQVDKQSGRSELLLETEERAEFLSVYGNSMVFAALEGLFFYDMEKKEWVEDAVVNDFVKSNYGRLEYNDMSSYPFLPFQAESDILYMAFRGGLYRHVIGGSSVEQVIDGSLSSFGNPSLRLVGMVALADNEFLTLFTGGKVVRHTYDPEMPTVPDKQISVYSLEQNDTMLQAIILFQARYPDIYVKYVVGMDESSSVTREDALKKLNTEILAGTGPDLMILDDMPLHSYMEKGILADITPYLTALEETETLLPNLRNAFKEGEVIYAVPARFKVPLIAGEKSNLDKISDLSSLADTIESIRGSRPEGNILGFYTETQVLRSLAMVCASAWQNEDGSVDETAISDFLTQAKRIYQAEVAGISAEDIAEFQEMNMGFMNSDGIYYDKSDYYLSVGGGSHRLASGDTSMTMGYIEDGFGFSILTSALDVVGSQETDIRGLTGQIKNSFIPDTIVGISASSANQEMAGELLKALLSQETMNLIYGAYPINKASFEKCFINTYNSEGNREIGMMSNGSSDGRESVLYISWPEDKWIDQVRTIMESADTLSLADSVLEDTILEEGVSALNGERTVEETVKAIGRKVSIYMAE